MAKARTEAGSDDAAAAAAKPRAPRSTPGLTIDGGAPPAPPKDGAAKRKKNVTAPAAAGPVVLPDQAAPPPPEWQRDTVKVIVSIPFMVAHQVAKRSGPVDAWKPGDDDLDLMVTPLLNMANRYTVLRALARFGDPIAFATATGAYVGTEARRIETWRAAHDPAAVPAVPDADIAGLGTRATAPRPPEPEPADPVSAGVRAWRPPVIPKDGT